MISARMNWRDALVLVNDDRTSAEASCGPTRAVAQLVDCELPLAFAASRRRPRIARRDAIRANSRSPLRIGGVDDLRIPKDSRELHVKTGTARLVIPGFSGWKEPPLYLTVRRKVERLRRRPGNAASVTLACTYLVRRPTPTRSRHGLNLRSVSFELQPMLQLWRFHPHARLPSVAPATMSLCHLHSLLVARFTTARRALTALC